MFTPLLVPLIDLHCMNVPLDAVTTPERTYVFFNTGFGSDRHTDLVLAHGEGSSLGAFVLDALIPSKKFLNVSTVQEGGFVYLFGSGVYRQSSVYLARVPLAEITNVSAYRYYSGMDDGVAVYGASEEVALPIITSQCVGELSVRRESASGALFMTYNCGDPRGIQLHTAFQPQGPWSAPLTIFDPFADEGYGHFMHIGWSGEDDGISEDGRFADSGGEYGPYLVPQWFHEDAPGVHDLTYVLSSWNPYTVHLMHTVVVEPGASAAPAPVLDAGLPTPVLHGLSDSAQWQANGDGFGFFTTADGALMVSTYGAKGDATTGTLSQTFTLDDQARELTFWISGGDAHVLLWDGDDVVRSSTGHRTNDVETLVRWRLKNLRGKTLRLEVSDDLTTPWGFVAARDFALSAKP